VTPATSLDRRSDAAAKFSTTPTPREVPRCASGRGRGRRRGADAHLGDGIGSALFVDGRLVPNLEFGHIEIDGHVAETRAAARNRDEEHLSWNEWAARLERYLRRIDELVWPDVIILGGEVTVDAARFVPLLDIRPRIKIATMRNAAGVVGAAMAVAD